MSVPSPRPGSRFAVLSESAFLAASWTWCIGMFLPVLLVRDFGVMGWVVFAVPNCLGAALMGVMLSRPGAVERVLNEHALAVRVFSFVTTAFQWFFAAWLLRAQLQVAVPALVVVDLEIVKGADQGIGAEKQGEAKQQPGRPRVGTRFRHGRPVHPVQAALAVTI